MITWKQQGAAIVGVLSLLDGQAANIVLVGTRDNPKGAMLVLAAAAGGKMQAMPLAQGLARLHPEAVIDALCMQERAYGSSEFLSPPEFGNPS